MIVNSEIAGARPEQVTKWGWEVPESVFAQVERDAKSDGRIDNTLFGMKERGYLEPKILMEHKGKFITHW